TSAAPFISQIWFWPDDVLRQKMSALPSPLKSERTAARAGVARGRAPRRRAAAPERHDAVRVLAAFVFICSPLLPPSRRPGPDLGREPMPWGNGVLCGGSHEHCAEERKGGRRRNEGGG